MEEPSRTIDAMPDHRQFVELLGRHERQLNAFVLSLVPNWCDADEIVQETRIALWDQFDQYDSTKSFGAWACTIARYKVLSFRKRKAQQAYSFSNEVLELLAEDFARQSRQESQRQEVLSSCLESLSQVHRNLLARCYGGSESIKEIAKQLGRSYLGLRQSLFRLRTVLYECVQRKLQPGEREP